MGSSIRSQSPTQVARKLLGRFLAGVGHRVTQVSFRFYQPPPPPKPPEEERLVPWLRVKGDKTLRQEYDLNESSVVFDVGGYEGQWASDIFSRYRCTVHVFEAVQSFAEQIERRFDRNNRVHVHRFGLGGATREARLLVSGDASSMLKAGPESAEVQVDVVRATEFIEQLGVGCIHLMKINIEGGEYELLDDLIESGCVQMIENIQIQFHDFIPDAAQRMIAIQNRLANTHFLTYQFPLVWENWKRRI